MSVPFAVIASAMIAWYVHERVEARTVAPIDWSGAGLLTTGLSTLLLVVLDGSSLGLSIDLVLLAVTALVLIGFVVRELRAADPILPMDLMIHPTIATSLIGNFLLGAILFGLETYVPLYIQGVGGGNAKEAGQTLTPLFLAWAISVVIAAKAVLRWGFRRGGMFGAGLVILGMIGLVMGTEFPAWRRPAFSVGLAFVGLGMGSLSLGFILAAQHAVGWGQRGVATGAVIFFRTIGGAVGVGVLGGALGWELGHFLTSAGATGIDVGAALRPETHHLLSAENLALVQLGLGRSLRDVYVQMFALALGTLACTAWLPSKSTSPASHRDPVPLAPTSEPELAVATADA